MWRCGRPKTKEGIQVPRENPWEGARRVVARYTIGNDLEGKGRCRRGARSALRRPGGRDKSCKSLIGCHLIADLDGVRYVPLARVDANHVCPTVASARKLDSKRLFKLDLIRLSLRYASNDREFHQTVPGRCVALRAQARSSDRRALQTTKAEWDGHRNIAFRSSRGIGVRWRRIVAGGPLRPQVLQRGRENPASPLPPSAEQPHARRQPFC